MTIEVTFCSCARILLLTEIVQYIDLYAYYIHVIYFFDYFIYFCEKLVS